MPIPRFVLHQFRSLLPPIERSQEQAVEWLAHAHSRAETSLPEAERHVQYEQMKKKFKRFGCSSEKINRRYSVLDDYSHQDFDRMQVFRLNEHPKGLATGKRTRKFSTIANQMIDRLYSEDIAAPDGLIHVTCTGYAAPSAGELLVSRRGWGEKTEVYHAYHMGCYASVPALKMAHGLLHSLERAGRIDVVHTEFCSMHLDSSEHSAEQIVIQSLFSDGIIRYSLSDRDSFKRSRSGETALEFLSARKELIPETENEMTWLTGDHGMDMTLSRTVPEKIASHLEAFLGRLYHKTPSGTVFAIHPGGPRIIEQVQDLLELEPSQTEACRTVLRSRGNMSSATLPHIWQHILEDPRVEDGTLVIALAFGPGLTIAGAALRKVIA